MSSVKSVTLPGEWKYLISMYPEIYGSVRDQTIHYSKIIKRNKRARGHNRTLKFLPVCNCQQMLLDDYQGPIIEYGEVYCPR